MKFKDFFKFNNTLFKKKQDTLLSAAIIIIIANFFSSISGLLRQRFLISQFFDTDKSRLEFEALKVAFQIPDSLYLLIVTGAVSAAFIPIFTTISKKDKQRAFEVTNSFMTILIIIYTLFAIVSFIFTKQLLLLFTGKEFTDFQMQTAVRLTRLMLVSQIFFTISNFFTGMLQSFQRFILPSIAPIVYNLGIIFVVFLLKNRFGIDSVALGVVFGAFLNMAIQIPLVYKFGYRFKLNLNFKGDDFKIFMNVIPLRTFTLALNILYQKLGLVFFTTSIGNLSLVMFDLALKLIAIPIRLSGVPISQAALPFLSSKADDKEKLKEFVIDSINQITYFVIPLSVLVLLLRVPFVRLNFGTKNFPWSATITTANIVAILSISIFFQAIIHLFLRVFYSLKDLKIPLLSTAVSIIFYFVLSSIFIFRYNKGVLSIAISMTITYMFESLFLLFFLNKRLDNFAFDKKLIFSQIKIFMAGFLMAVFTYLPFRALDLYVFNTTKTKDLLSLTTVTSTIGLLVFIYFSILFDIKQFDLILKLLNKFKFRADVLSKAHEVVIDNDGDLEEF